MKQDTQENVNSHNEKVNGSIFIHSGFLYCADVENTVIEHAWVYIENQIIKDFGSSACIKSGADFSSYLKEKAETVIDAKGKMILPGFVNAHWHESFVAPNFEKPDDSDLMPTSYCQGGDIEALGKMFGFISTVGDKLTYDEGLAIARFSLWTQLRSGTTAIGDVGSANRTECLAQAAIDLGMRIRVSRWGSDIMIPNTGNEAIVIADRIKQADDWQQMMQIWYQHNSGLVDTMPSLMGTFGSSDKQLALFRDLLDQYDTIHAMHLAALKNENESIKRVFGKGSIERVKDFGLLNSKLLAVHTAFVDEQEYQMLMDAKVNINHSPAHYGILGESTISETKQIGRMFKEGVWVSSSTDGDISYVGGMPEALRCTHLCHNEAHNSNLACPPNLALKSGTLFGAKALGWHEKIGSIEKNKEADIVLINCDDYRYFLGNHPLRTYLVTGNSKDVDTVIVKGEIVVQDSKSTRFDEKELYNDYLSAAKSARARIGAPS